MAFPEHDLQIAATFLGAFGGAEAQHVWQVFPEDGKETKVPGQASVRDPGELVFGALADVADRLIARNLERRGISVTIAETKRRGRKLEDIARQRALWLDFDRGLPDTFGPVPPSIVVKTPRGGHAYWLLHAGDGTDLDRWVRIQRALGQAFRKAETISDAAKAMRCPGFLHCKQEPKRVELGTFDPDLRYWSSDVVAGFDLRVVERQAAPSHVVGDVPLQKRIERCRRYVDACRSLVQGLGQTQLLANGMCGIGGDFGLEPDEYWPLLQAWNDRGNPPLDEAKLRKRLDSVHKNRRDAFGFRLERRTAPPQDLVREGILADAPWPEDEDDTFGGARKIYRSAEIDPARDQLDPTGGTLVGRRSVARHRSAPPESPWFEQLPVDVVPPPEHEPGELLARDRIPAHDDPPPPGDHDAPPPEEPDVPAGAEPPFVPPDDPPPRDDEGGGGGKRKSELVLDRDAPLETAKAFAAFKFQWKGPDGKARRILMHHQRTWYVWNGRAYREVSREDLNARLYSYLAPAVTYNAKGEIVKFNPDESRVNKVRHALESVSHLDDERTPPCWTPPANASDPQPPSHEIVACRNGLLHLPTGDWLGPRPDFYSLTSLGVAYNPDAPEPKRWLAFLDQLWPDDRHSIQLLQEWFGLTLVPDTSFQKLLFVIGPRRSGKGTIARVMSELHGGEHNCAWLSMNDLVSRFGLHPLLAKSVAIMPDVRISPKLDQSEAVEKILRITGEDSLQIDRKNLPVIHGQIGARFMLMSNLPPRLSDAGAAFVSRVLALRMEQSFLGNEDRDLKRKLIGEMRGSKRVGGELPGILLWAIEGWRRLVERGHFVQPETAREIVEDMAELSTPVVGFVRSSCMIGNPEDWVHGDTLFDAWRSWCETEGREAVGEKSTFVRNLRAAYPSLTTRRNRVPSPTGDSVRRVKVMYGIRMLTDQELDEREREYEQNGGRPRPRQRSFGEP